MCKRVGVKGCEDESWGRKVLSKLELRFLLKRSLQGGMELLKKILGCVGRALTAPVGLLGQLVIIVSPIFFSLIMMGFFDKDIFGELFILPEWGVVAFSLMVVSTMRSLHLARHGRVKSSDLEAGVAFNFLVALTAMLAFVFSFLHSRKYVVFVNNEEFFSLMLLEWINVISFSASVFMYVAMHVRISILQKKGYLERFE